MTSPSVYPGYSAIQSWRSSQARRGLSGRRGAFTLAEVLVTVVVCAVFCTGAFAVNSQMLKSLRAQKETNAATMMLQERLEAFRALAYSDVTSNVPQLPANITAADIVRTGTTSEAALGNLSETITVSGYLTKSGTAGNYPTDGSRANKWLRNAQFPTGQSLDTNSSLVASYDLVKVDILLSWVSADGRRRTRQIATIFGKGNIGG